MTLTRSPLSPPTRRTDSAKFAAFSQYTQRLPEALLPLQSLPVNDTDNATGRWMRKSGGRVIAVAAVLRGQSCE